MGYLDDYMAGRLYGGLPWIIYQSVFKGREVYTPETPCMKRTSVYVKSMWIKQLCNDKVWDFATAFRLRKLLRTFEKRARRSSWKMAENFTMGPSAFFPFGLSCEAEI